MPSIKSIKEWLLGVLILAVLVTAFIAFIQIPFIKAFLDEFEKIPFIRWLLGGHSGELAIKFLVLYLLIQKSIDWFKKLKK